MSNKKGTYSRRDFLKTAGAIGVGSMLSPVESITNAQESSNPNESPVNVVPTRPFGKTGVDVSILSLGGAFHYSNLLLMKQALDMGVTYWDTSPGYGGGQSEAGIGKYFDKLKAVWDDDRIASICSYMTNMRYLSENASAAMDNKKLSDHDIDCLKDYARKTASSYCAGCKHICESITDGKVPISAVMRYLMYSRCYGESERAKSAFKELPSEVRGRMAVMDFRDAENRCPQGMPIGRLIREAVIELA